MQVAEDHSVDVQVVPGYMAGLAQRSKHRNEWQSAQWVHVRPMHIPWDPDAAKDIVFYNDCQSMRLIYIGAAHTE